MPRLNSRLRQARREYARAALRYAEFAFQMRVELVGIEPPIWRRFVVSGALEARHVHRVLERVMGWQGGHMSGVHFPRPAGATARRLLLGDRLEVGERFGSTTAVSAMGLCWAPKWAGTADALSGAEASLQVGDVSGGRPVSLRAEHALRPRGREGRQAR